MKRNGQMVSAQRSLKPTAFQASLKFTKILRYIATANINSQVSAQNLAAILMAATSATTGFSLVGAIRLNKIEAWTPAIPGANVSLEYTQETTTFIGSPSVIVSDTCTSSTFPAYVALRPPKNSLSGFWVSGNATSTGHMVDIVCSENTVIDFHVDLVLLDQSTVGQSVTSTGTVAGVLYMKLLCGGTLAPVSFPGY